MKRAFVAATIAIAATSAMADGYKFISQNIEKDGAYYLLDQDIEKTKTGYTVVILNKFDQPKNNKYYLQKVSGYLYVYDMPCKGNKAIMTAAAPLSSKFTPIEMMSANDTLDFAPRSAMGIVQDYLCKGER